MSKLNIPSIDSTGYTDPT